MVSNIMREHRNDFMKLLQLKNNKHKSKHFSNTLMKYQYLGMLTSFFFFQLDTI